jgi:hypothetical protein
MSQIICKGKNCEGLMEPDKASASGIKKKALQRHFVQSRFVWMQIDL